MEVSKSVVRVLNAWHANPSTVPRDALWRALNREHPNWNAWSWPHSAEGKKLLTALKRELSPYEPPTGSVATEAFGWDIRDELLQKLPDQTLPTEISRAQVGDAILELGLASLHNFFYEYPPLGQHMVTQPFSQANQASQIKSHDNVVLSIAYRLLQCTPADTQFTEKWWSLYKDSHDKEEMHDHGDCIEGLLASLWDEAVLQSFQGDADVAISAPLFLFVDLLFLILIIWIQISFARNERARDHG